MGTCGRLQKEGRLGAKGKEVDLSGFLPTGDLNRISPSYRGSRAQNMVTSALFYCPLASPGPQASFVPPRIPSSSFSASF